MTPSLATAELIQSPALASVSDCSDVSCGNEFTMWLCHGKVFSAGLPQYGQLGHNTDHEYNAKDCKLPIFPYALLSYGTRMRRYVAVLLSHLVTCFQVYVVHVSIVMLPVPLCPVNAKKLSPRKGHVFAWATLTCMLDSQSMSDPSSCHAQVRS